MLWWSGVETFFCFSYFHLSIANSNSFCKRNHLVCLPTFLLKCSRGPYRCRISFFPFITPNITKSFDCRNCNLLLNAVSLGNTFRWLASPAHAYAGALDFNPVSELPTEVLSICSYLNSYHLKVEVHDLYFFRFK